jgi:hypothetical protein
MAVAVQPDLLERRRRVLHDFETVHGDEHGLAPYLEVLSRSAHRSGLGCPVSITSGDAIGTPRAEIGAGMIVQCMDFSANLSI